MQSFDFNLIISNGDEYSSARVVLTNVSWIPGNIHVLINDAMRQRLNIGLSNTLPFHDLAPKTLDIISSCGPYRTCENAYLSVDPIAYRLRSIAHPVFVPDLPLDFVLGTLYFDELNLIWSSNLFTRLADIHQS